MNLGKETGHISALCFSVSCEYLPFQELYMESIAFLCFASFRKAPLAPDHFCCVFLHCVQLSLSKILPLHVFPLLSFIFSLWQNLLPLYKHMGPFCCVCVCLIVLMILLPDCSSRISHCSWTLNTSSVSNRGLFGCVSFY